MKKFSGTGFRIWTAILLLLSIGATVPSAVSATSATSSALGTGVSAELNQLESEIASKAAALKNTISTQIQNKVYEGFVQTISDTQYTLTNLNGESRLVIINQFTKTEVNGKKLSSTISKGDFISALGDVNDYNALVAQRIIKSASPSSTSVGYLWGKILDTTISTITISDKNSQKQVIAFTPDTVFNLGTTDASPAQAKVNNFLVGVGTFDKKGDFTVRFIYLYPPTQTSPTPPASSSATQSGKKKQY